MKGLAYYFFLAAVLCVTLGMAWGIEMSVRGDHAMAGAHAHLNLVGWVTLGMFGLYYHLTPQAAEGGLAKAHLAIAIAGVITIVPGIAMAIAEKGEGLAKLGSLLTAISMVIFLITVMRHGFGKAD